MMIMDTRTRNIGGLLLLALACLLSDRTATAFSASTTTCRRNNANKGALMTQNKIPERLSLVLFASGQDPSDEEDSRGIAKGATSLSEDSLSSDSVSTEESRGSAPEWLRQSVFVALSGSSAIFSTICLGFALGLVLNLCGYGYMWIPGQGFRIDTLPQIRQEVQFQREIQKSMAEAARDRNAKIALQQQQQQQQPVGGTDSSSSMISSSNLAKVVAGGQSSASTTALSSDIWEQQSQQQETR